MLYFKHYYFHTHNRSLQHMAKYDTNPNTNHLENKQISQHTQTLKTLQKSTTITIPPTSTAPRLRTTPKTTPSPKTSNQSSTTILKARTTPSKQTTSPSKQLPFTFYLITNRLNYISNLNLPRNLAKLFTEIQCNYIAPKLSKTI